MEAFNTVIDLPRFLEAVRRASRPEPAAVVVREAGHFERPVRLYLTDMAPITNEALQPEQAEKRTLLHALTHYCNGDLRLLTTRNAAFVAQLDGPECDSMALSFFQEQDVWSLRVWFYNARFWAEGVHPSWVTFDYAPPSTLPQRRDIGLLVSHVAAQLSSAFQPGAAALTRVQQAFMQAQQARAMADLSTAQLSPFIDNEDEPFPARPTRPGRERNREYFTEVERTGATWQVRLDMEEIAQAEDRAGLSVYGAPWSEFCNRLQTVGALPAVSGVGDRFWPAALTLAEARLDRETYRRILEAASMGSLVIAVDRLLAEHQVQIAFRIRPYRLVAAEQGGFATGGFITESGIDGTELAVQLYDNERFITAAELLATEPSQEGGNPPQSTHEDKGRRLSLNHKQRGKPNESHYCNQGDQDRIYPRLARRRPRAE